MCSGQTVFDFNPKLSSNPAVNNLQFLKPKDAENAQIISIASPDLIVDHQFLSKIMKNHKNICYTANKKCKVINIQGQNVEKYRSFPNSGDIFRSKTPLDQLFLSLMSKYFYFNGFIGQI